MLKGHVFSKQLFGNPIFALFINTFTDGKNGVSNNYKNGMALSYSGSNVTIQSGAVCIQGRFLEEDASTTISAGTDTMFCKLVIEIDLDKTNTESDFLQGAYKVIKSASAYPTLTQTNIVKNNAGVYQYELARFKTTGSGITDFEDKRTYLDFTSIYTTLENEAQALISEIEDNLDDVLDGSIYLLKSNIAILSGTMSIPANDSLTRYINYPTGFDKDNTIVISVELATDEESFDIPVIGNGFDYNTQLVNNTAIDFLYSVRKWRPEIDFTVKNPTNVTKKLKYKIYLMKVS